MRPANWTGTIKLHFLQTGERKEIKNAILDGGLTLTAELWLGLTTETFDQLVAEGAGAGESVSKALTGNYAVTGGVATVTSTAIFTSGELTFDVTTIALVGSEGTRIAEATVNIPAGSAVEVTREDTLSEVSP